MHTLQPSFLNTITNSVDTAYPGTAPNCGTPVIEAVSALGTPLTPANSIFQNVGNDWTFTPKLSDGFASGTTTAFQFKVTYPTFTDPNTVFATANFNAAVTAC